MDSQILGYIVLAIFGTPIAVGSCVMIFLIGFQPNGDQTDWASPAAYNPMKNAIERQSKLRAKTAVSLPAAA